MTYTVEQAERDALDLPDYERAYALEQEAGMERRGEWTHETDRKSK